MDKLPIYDLIDEIKTTLQNNNTLILQAPPGAGKSTVVPISLLDEPWLEDGVIIMLEPRRVAARAVAQRMADLLREKVGEKVGYIVKNDSCRSKDTKIVVVTEAILVRMIQDDQSLEGVSAVIFDEFHERSINTDLSLALSLEVQQLLRDDLKLLIMSATLNSNALLKTLGKVPVLTSKGRLFEVENIYLPKDKKQPDHKTINDTLLETILHSLENDKGDILVFLAGVKEIRTLQNELLSKTSSGIRVCPLYSALSKKEQDRALYEKDKRKVILSTNIAQTSLTIEGVSVVIDTGLEKLSVYDYTKGMDRLQLQFISNDSAIQRAGRAGRISHGKCYRLWHQGKILTPSTKAEILRVDLSSLLLEVKLWGSEDIEELTWLDIPAKSSIDETNELLKQLGMVDSLHSISKLGNIAVKFSTHPRLSFMILKSYEMGYGFEGCLLASIIENKDIFNGSYKSSDLYDRFIHLYENDLDHKFINRYMANEVLLQAKKHEKKLQELKEDYKRNIKTNKEILSVLLLFAYPDRLAKLRQMNTNRYKLSNSKRAFIDFEDTLFNQEYLVVSNLNGKDQTFYINQSLPIEKEDIKKHFTHIITSKQQVKYNKETKKFDIKENIFFSDLLLESKAVSSKDIDFTILIKELLVQEGLELLTWSKKAIDLKNRVVFLAQHKSEQNFPSFDDKILLESIDIWLEPYLEGIKSIKELETLDMYNILLGQLSWEQQQRLQKLVPTHIKVPSGSNIKIDYSNVDNPILSVRIQELFGMISTPKILKDTISLQIHLLSPAQRAIQITYDLKSFWENSYEEAAKELRGKYPKHYWPKNPLEAQATNKTKKTYIK
ncbi:MAG: ATP-dependent helicase HrpB [Campylobacterota bacterium]|nr:ATP-dependent helicase HrpB [Campylobacterota bacterium]